MAQRVRVRYAPSPTGEPHVGNVRTALFTWLFARHSGGSFIVRIEDTDQARKVEGATERLLDALRWLGLDWDEGPDVGGDYGPYVQSQRLPRYHEVAEQLVGSGNAYRCYCSHERLSALRQEHAKGGEPPGYDGHCRGLGEAERRASEVLLRLDGRHAPVIRFKMPREGVTTVPDLVRGEVSFENRLVDDFVMLKSDGYPTYHLAHLVDDHDMQISHVLRAEEWLPSTPRHLKIYESLGWRPPLFAHVPIILAPDRSKLSKRHGATSALEFRDMGYLPEAMVNFLALLGWSLDDETDLISREDLIKRFTIERIGKSPSIFRPEKLDWMNGHYIRALPNQELADRLLDYWRRRPPADFDGLPPGETLLQVAPLIRERIKTLRDAAPLVAFLFKKRLDYDVQDLVQKGMDREGTRGALEAALERLSGIQPFDADAVEGTLRPLADELGLKPGQLFGSLRIAVTGQRVAPPLFETLQVLGRERSVGAIAEALARLGE